MSRLNSDHSDCTAAIGCTACAVPRLRAPADVYAAVPSLSSLHQLLGLEERIVLGACRGVPMVAQRFSNWTKGGAPYFLAYDDEPAPGAYLPFTQYWLKGAIEGLRVGYEEFSLGTACARLGRVPVTAGPDDPLSASYGYQLDALAYSELAKQFALRIGVEAASSTLHRVEVVGDRISAIELFDETRLNADLYVDASGPEMRLISELESAEFESWAKWLPCDRLLAASAPQMLQLPSFSQVSAFGGGWVGLFPIRHRTGVIAAYNSSAVAIKNSPSTSASLRECLFRETRLSASSGLARRRSHGSAIASRSVKLPWRWTQSTRSTFTWHTAVFRT